MGQMESGDMFSSENRYQYQIEEGGRLLPVLLIEATRAPAPVMRAGVDREAGRYPEGVCFVRRGIEIG